MTSTLHLLKIVAASFALLLFSAVSVQAAEITVDTTSDEYTDRADCTDADAGTDCTLREALAAANADTSSDHTITLPSGTITMSTSDSGSDEDSSEEGDYDLEVGSTSTVTITGAGMYDTVVDANDLDRVFDILLGASANLTFSDMTIQNGSWTDSPGGAGIFSIGGATAGTLTIDSVYFYSNDSNHYGGAINANTVDKLVITHSYFEENTANQGAGLYYTGDILKVSYSAFYNNSASGQGGGIDVTNITSAIIQQTQFVENFAANYGAIDFFVTTDDLQAKIYNSSFINNQSSSSTSSISSRVWGAGTGTTDVELFGTILTSTSNDNCGVSGVGTFTTAGYNIENGDSCELNSSGTDIVNTDPLIIAEGIADNGGDIETIGLQSTSAAVDMIPAASCLDADGLSLTTDIRGMTRPENTDCDAGAYELDQTGATVTLDSGNVTLECGVDTWSAPTVMSVVDNFDTTVTTASLESNNTDESTVGSYNAVYASTEDYDGNVGRASQAVNVVDTTAPTITLTGDEEVVIEQGESYTESGATVADLCESGLSATVGGDTVDTDTPGEYTVTYNVTDAEGNTGTEVTRTVTVAPDTTAPTITIVGESSVTVEFGATYTDDGATATDAVDGDLTSSIVTVNPVDTDTAGTYTVTYNVTDEAGNVAAEVTRTVIVSEEVVEDQDPDIGEGDGTEDTEATLGAVTQVTRLANNMVTITYAEGETKTFNVFGGTAKAKVKLHSNGDVLIAISKKYIRTFDAYTGEKIDQKKLFKNKQKYTKFKKYNVYNASDDNTANSVIVLARTKKNQHKKVKMRHIVVKNDGTMSKKNVVNVTLNKKIKKFKNVSLKRNKKNGKNFRVTLTKKGKKLKNFKYKVTKKKKQLKKV